MTLFRKRVFADIIKDVKRALPRMTQVGPTFSGMYSYKNKAEEI